MNVIEVFTNTAYNMYAEGRVDEHTYQLMLETLADRILEENGYDVNGGNKYAKI